MIILSFLSFIPCSARPEAVPPSFKHLNNHSYLKPKKKLRVLHVLKPFGKKVSNMNIIKRIVGNFPFFPILNQIKIT